MRAFICWKDWRCGICWGKDWSHGGLLLNRGWIRLDLFPLKIQLALSRYALD